MTKKYKCSFYILLSVLFLLVQINCGRVPPRRNTYASKASRRQEHPGEGPPVGPILEGGPGNLPLGPPKSPNEPGIGPPPPSTVVPDDENSDSPLQTLKITDLPEEAIDHALILDYGRYSTINFHYQGNQWIFSPEIDVCYDEYTKCYTSIIAPTPVCMMHSAFNVRTVFSYCDVYFYNCRIGDRYWRIAGFGDCVIGVFGYPYLVES